MEKADKYPYQKIKEELKNSEYDRTFSHWTAEEDEALISRHTQLQLSNLEIAKHHRRTLGSIKARLKLHGYPDKSPGDFVDQFANYLRNGINPITGEILSEDSAWLHPKITLQNSQKTVAHFLKIWVFQTTYFRTSKLSLT